MNADSGGNTTAGSDLPPATQVELALDRTFLAHERTLMAWVRTAMSLVTFGFALFKVFLYLEQSGTVAPSRQVLGPRTYGIIIIAVSVFALIAAIVQHVLGLKRLRRQSEHLPRSIAWVPALVFAGIAVLALGVSLFENL